MHNEAISVFDKVKWLYYLLLLFWVWGQIRITGDGLYSVQSIVYTPCSKKRSPCCFYCSVYKCWPISIMFDTQYTEVICNITIIYMSTSPVYCCYTTSEILTFGFLDNFGWFVLSTKLFTWPRNVTMKSDKWKIFTVAYYHDVELNTGARGASSTCAITVTLTSSIKTTVPAHWCVHQTIELLQHETPKFTGPGLLLGLCGRKRRLL